jgi:hypothetical protein
MPAASTFETQLGWSGRFEDPVARESQFGRIDLNAAAKTFRAVRVAGSGETDVVGSYIVRETCWVDPATVQTECRQFLTLREQYPDSRLEQLETFAVVSLLRTPAEVVEITLKPMQVDQDQESLPQTLVRASDDLRPSMEQPESDALRPPMEARASVP